MNAGTLRVREPVGARKVTAIEVFAPGGLTTSDALGAGQIGKVSGLGLRVGDTLGAANGRAPFLRAPDARDGRRRRATASPCTAR